MLDCPNLAAVFAKIEPNKKKVQLSGAEAFNSIVIPLVNASDHASQQYGHVFVGPNGRAVSPKLVISLAVLGAPMVLVEGSDRISDPILTPRVWVVRQEPNLDGRHKGSTKNYAIDVVHVEFPDTLLEQHILPSARDFAVRAVHMGSGPMINGGQVPNIDRWNWSEIEERDK